MLILRLLAVVVLLVVAGGVVAYLLTRNAKYLHFSWQIFRYSLIVALLVFALMVLERVVVIPL
ncbi:MAG: hypothetical protein QG584_2763 [Pseudomonadota bacterium]|nr:hypothetical protein [Pseudomonadota bacterium]